MMRQLSASARVVVVLLALVSLCAPRAVAGQGAVDTRRAIASDAAIKVWNGGGSVRLEGWDRDSLVVTGVVGAAGGGRFFLRAEEDVAKLGIEGDQAEVEGRLVVRLPAGATVWIRTVSADISVRGLVGSVDIHTVAGAVDAAGQPETLYAESMAGNLTLEVDAGIVRANAGTGSIAFTGTADDLTLNAVSGTLDVTAPALRRARLTTVDGAVAFTGGVRPAGAVVVETHAGDVTLRLPADLAADFRLSTFGGEIDAGYPEAPTAAPEPGRRSVRFETGDGGAQVEARSYSGSITVVPR